MSERITDERLAELIAEEKEIAESDLVLQLEASWAAEVTQALTELTERRAQESASTVEYSARGSSHVFLFGFDREYAETRVAELRAEGYDDRLYERRAWRGSWVEVEDDV